MACVLASPRRRFSPVRLRAAAVAFALLIAGLTAGCGPLGSGTCRTYRPLFCADNSQEVCETRADGCKECTCVTPEQRRLDQPGPWPISP